MSEILRTISHILYCYDLLKELSPSSVAHLTGDIQWLETIKTSILQTLNVDTNSETDYTAVYTLKSLVTTLYDQHFSQSLSRRK